MDVKGDFTHLELPELLKKPLDQQLNCVLLMKSGNRSLRVHYGEGKISFISSSDPDERFGEHLLYKNTITWEQYREASVRMKETGERLGALLVKLGFVSYEELLHGLTAYILDLGSTLFRTKRGRYAFLQPENPDALPMELYLDPRRLIYNGIRRYQHLSLVRQIMPDGDVVPAYRDSEEAVFRVLEMDVEEQSILEWINGRNTVSSICSFSTLPEFNTLQVLAGLAYCGFVNMSRPKDQQMSEQEIEFHLEDLLRKYNEPFQTIYHFLTEKNADTFAVVQEGALNRLEAEHGSRLRGLDLNNYGFMDFEILYRNVYPIPAQERIPETERLLQQLLKAFIVETGRVLDKPAMAELKEKVSRHERPD